MLVRKRLDGKQRMAALGYGLIAIVVALLIATYGIFQWNAAIAFVIGLFGVGGVYRCFAGYDEI